EGNLLLTRGQVPQQDCPIPAPGSHQGLMVRTERYGHNPAVGPLNAELFLARGDIPYAEVAVQIPCSQCLAIWAEGHGHDGSGKALEGNLFLTGSHIPELNGAVLVAGSQGPAIRGDCLARDNTGRTSHPEDTHRRTRGRIPDMDDTISSGC